MSHAINTIDYAVHLGLAELFDEETIEHRRAIRFARKRSSRALRKSPRKRSKPTSGPTDYGMAGRRHRRIEW